MNGWMGTILRVDLSKKLVTKEPLEEELVAKFVGGKGLSTKYLYDEIKPGIDPLGPDNKVIFGVGPCNGTLSPGGSRFTIATKSPLSGFIGDANSGGTFGAGLKYAGYDMLIIEGKAEKPLYLWMEDDRVELRDAGHLWGKTTAETKRVLETELGDPEVCVVSIGPAGENLVKFAAVIADLGRAAGRTGIGAVLGSKKLKAIAVKGTKGVKVANPKLLEEAAMEVYQLWRVDWGSYQAWSKMGPTSSMIRYHNMGILPTKNYLRGTFPEGIQSVTGERIAEGYFVKPKACFSCPVPTDHLFIIDKGPYAGTYGEGLEMAQLEHFSSRVMIDDLDFTAKATALSDEYGVDCMDMAAIIGYAMECFDNGILTEKDTDGLRVDWGNASAALKLMELTTYRKGIGDLFAEGVKRASEKIGQGSERFAVHVKGLSISTRDPRGCKGWGLGYAVGARGADHCRHLGVAEGVALPGSIGFDPVRGEVIGEPGKDLNPLSEEGKGQLIYWYENLRYFQNCMENCINFPRYRKDLGLPGTMAKFFNAVTGWELSSKDVMRIGERIVNLDRAFNVREGLTRKDDSLPERFLKETLPEGPAKGSVVNLEPMLDEYYEVRGWDKISGFPTRAKLEELGLKKEAEELKKMGRLAE